MLAPRNEWPGVGAKRASASVTGGFGIDPRRDQLLPLTNGRSAARQAVRPPSSQCTLVKPALVKRLQASAEVWPFLQTTATGRSRTFASSLLSGSNWLI